YGAVLTACLMASTDCGALSDLGRPPNDGGVDGPLDAGDARFDGPTEVNDAAVDRMPDSPAASVGYDIAYISEFTLPYGVSSISSFLRIVNTDTAPLNVSTASVVSFSDDTNTGDLTFERLGETTLTIQPGHAAGCLSPAATEKLVGGGIVTEPIEG